MVAPPALANNMTRLPHLLACCLCAPLVASYAHAAMHVVIVEGLGGDERYTSQFAEQVAAAQTAAESVTGDERVSVFRADVASRDAVIAHFNELATNLGGDDQLTVYLIGHGSFDDHEYKFNLPGPDLTDTDIEAALGAVQTTNQVLINTSSASGGAAEKWAAEGRVVITATRSGSERHATRFGTYFVAALSEAGADIDKNGVVSAKEAFEFGQREVENYFDVNGQLATEHARIEGERTDRFNLSRLGGLKPDSDDALLQELLAERDVITSDIDTLRLARGDMEQTEYQQELLQRMLDLATVEESIEEREGELGLAQ